MWKIIENTYHPITYMVIKYLATDKNLLPHL